MVSCPNDDLGSATDSNTGRDNAIANDKNLPFTKYLLKTNKFQTSFMQNKAGFNGLCPIDGPNRKRALPIQLISLNSGLPTGLPN